MTSPGPPPPPLSRVVLAVDSFKGSISAVAATSALAAGVAEIRPDLEIIRAPIADGGEGTVEALMAAGFTSREVPVRGPFGELVNGIVGVRRDFAVVELASAAGLHLVDGAPDSRSSRTASTYGVGQLVEAAVRAGASTVAVALGGSCTTDGGAGLVEALGARLLDHAGSTVPAGGAGLLEITHVDLSGLRRPRGVRLLAATDVDNPLLGRTGAVATYAEQKGAGPADRADLERALTQWAAVVDRATSRPVAHLPGTGAAGGAAYGLAAVLQAEIVSGADLVLDLLGFDRLVDPHSLVVVGEGCLDGQSLRGKGPVTVARRAALAGAQVAAVTGVNKLDRADLEAAGIASVHQLSDLEPDPQRSKAHADRLLRHVGRALAASMTP